MRRSVLQISDEVSERDGKNGEDNEVGKDEAVNKGCLPKAVQKMCSSSLILKNAIFTF